MFDGFNKSHTLAYSLIALQEMNLAYKYPIMFWNCACLIADSGGAEEEESDNIINIDCEEEFHDTYYNEMEEFTDDDSEDDVEDEYDKDENCDGYPVEVKVMKDGKKKKKVKATNYGKIASAIGKMKNNGIEIAAPDINKSTFTFSPDIEDNTIRYGLSGITRIGNDLITKIIENRPYSDISDFSKKIKLNKPQFINLIKSGAMDDFDDRIKIMKDYIESISDKKNRVTLQNMKMLIDFGLLPEELSFQCKVYNFNKYIKKHKQDIYYLIDNIALQFFESNFDMDKLVVSDEENYPFKIKQVIWDKIYQSQMDIVRPYVKEHNQELLSAINDKLYNDMWEKYALGGLSKWEMDSVSFYSHEHELASISKDYKFDDFSRLPDEPEIDYVFPIDGKQIPIFKLSRIAGTILDKDKNKKTLSLLTTTGVVNVKIFGAVFSHYDKQLSRKDESTGKKKVIEKSWFSRGNKIIVTGIKRDDMFIAKKYARTPYHLVELITGIDEYGYLELKKEREEI